MNNKLSELVKVNFRYANPQMTDKARKSGKTGKKLTRSLVNQYLLSGIVFIALYGVMLLSVNFKQMPGFFTYYVALFGIIAFSQGISVIYNIFFESQDLPGYLPLPFRQSEIFLAKIIVVTITIVPFTLPVFVVFLLAGMQAGVFIPLAILLAFVLFGLFLAIIFSICSIIVFGLTRTTFFKKHKKLVTTLLLVFSMGIAIVGILLMNTQSTSEIVLTDRATIRLLMPFFYVVTAPLATVGLSSLLGLIVVTIGLLVILRKRLLPKLYEQLLDASPGVSSEKRKYKANQSLRQLLFGYNFQLIRDPNLIMQVFSNSVLFPVIFIVAFGISGQFELSWLPYRVLGVVFFAGIAFSAMTINPMSFVGNIISLDKENFLYMRTLPISMRHYLKTKFWFACGVQMIISAVIALAGGLFFHLRFAHMLALLAGILVGTYLFSQRYFVRDYRLLELRWTNVSQLFTRGAGTWGLALLMTLTVFCSVLLVVVYGFLAIMFSVWVIDVPVFLVLLIISVVWYEYYQRKFWSRFD